MICQNECIILLLSILIFGCQSKDRQQKIDLSGKWLFSLDEAKVGLIEKWYEGKLKTAGNRPVEITLPGTTDEAEAGFHNPQKPSLWGLYRPNTYTGPAWYQREINIPETWNGKHATLFLERNHWVTHVWLDGQDFGMHNNVVSPQVYDLGINLTPGQHRLTICVDNTLIYDLGRNANIWLEDTQTNWNGIIGAIEIRADDPIRLTKVDVYPDVDRKLIKVEASINNFTGSPAIGDIQFSVTDAITRAGIGESVSVSFSTTSDKYRVSVEVPMGDNPKLWDEFSPNLYILKASLSTRSSEFKSQKTVTFGMRKLAIRGTQFTMNGRTLLLRGTLDCAIYPLTGYPPTDIESWKRTYKIIKSYGLNFIRFHSWTPPEAAFTAADQEGIMIQAEGPVGNIGKVGIYPETDAFIEQELLGAVHSYGNHPSFCLLTLGNEYDGPDSLLTWWLDTLIKSDPRHFYSSASSGQVTANCQWNESTAGRGIHGPNTMNNAMFAITRQVIPHPVIGHEIGQWSVFPNLSDIRKYTGVLKAKNFELICDSLQSIGMLDQAQLFVKATGQQSVLLYKEEIENLLRTPGYAGFSLLDLHDYPGKGTSLVGLLDPFWDSKGLITPKEHKLYCGSTVPLLRIPKRTYTTTEAFSGKVKIAHFGPVDLTNVQPEWTIRDEEGQLVANGSLATLNLTTGRLTELGDISTPLDKAAAPGKFIITVSLKNTSFANSWDIWIYPPPSPAHMPNNVTISHKWDEATKVALAAGKNVVLFPDSLDNSKFLIGSFLPVFWSPVMLKSNPNTMGILCDPKHPLFSEFPTDFYSNWQWWNIIKGSKSIILNDTPAAFRPLVQVIDNFARNYKLGNVFEAKVGDGNLLVCSLNLKEESLPETSAFLKSLYSYVGSNSFRPSNELDFITLDKIFSRQYTSTK